MWIENEPMHERERHEFAANSEGKNVEKWVFEFRTVRGKWVTVATIERLSLR